MLRNSRFAHATVAVALLGLSVTAATPAHAGSYTYNTQQRQINAGILIVEDATPGASPTPNLDPYPFYILNQRSDVKPAGWSIVNPMAPKIVTTDVNTRWDAYALAIPGNPYGVGGTKHVYDLGLPVTQDMAPYWEVNFGTGTSADDLRQFDILLIYVRSSVRFTAHQKELLRQYVDGGGQLLIETTQAATPAITDLFFKVDFKSGNFVQANLPAVGGPFRHPILNEPNILGQSELRSLGHSADFGAGKFGAVTSVFSTLDATKVDLYGLLTNVLNNENNDPVIKAGQLGAGEVIIDTTASAHSINGFLGGFDVTSGLPAGNTDRYTAPNSGPYCNSNAGGAIASGVTSTFSLAPIADMKFLVNVMSWSGVHSSENGGSHQNSVSTDVAAAAVRPTWSGVEGAAFSSSPAAPYYTAGSPGSAIFGHYVAVVDKGVNARVHVYDLIPGEDLDSDGNPDDGTVDYQNGAPYDELWSAPVGAFASAPTIAATPNQAPTVFVEKDDGSVTAFDLVTGAVQGTPIGGTTAYSGLGTAGPSFAPAPTYYNGKLYAGRADGTVAVHDFASGSSWSFTLQPDGNNALTTQWVTASPAIVTNWLNGGNGQTDSNDLILYASTNRYLYTVFLGSFNETMSLSGTGYQTKITQVIPSGLGQIEALLTNGLYDTYSLSNGYENHDVPPLAKSGDTAFTSGAFNTIGADYFATPVNANGPGLVRTAVGVSAQEKSYSATTGAGSMSAGFSAYVSAPAVDKNGYAYVTVNDSALGSSAIECIQDGVTIADRRVRWRFRMPNSNDTGSVDAAGIDYSTQLLGMHFIGAPVIDRNGRVYALAADNAAAGNRAAVLCFDTNQTIGADLFGAGGGATGTIASYTITQPRADTLSEFGTPAAVPLIQGLQFNGAANGHIDFLNFAVPGSGAPGLYPNLSEPQPVQVSYTLYDGTNNVPVGPVSIPVSTNMKWCVYSTTQGPVSAGLTLVGDYVFFGDTAGRIYRVGVQIDPAVVNANFRFVPGTTSVDQHKKKLWASQPSGIDAIDAVPASGSGSLIVNGYNVKSAGNIAAATAALQNKKTIVLDGDRLAEFDADGELVWALDSTSKSTVAGGYFDATGSAATGATGKVVVTHSDLNHPASVTQHDQNDYLVADTGNNRCVEIDRTGKVVWELTRFRDPGGLLANSGQPTTLNHPTSIRVRSIPFTSANGTPLTQVTYLIADTGNHRIIEVSDIFSGTTVVSETDNHRLTWVSHTYDQLGRKYNYTSADYLFAPDGNSYVVGLIGNYRVGQFPDTMTTAPDLGTQAPLSADGPGGSIVMLDYAIPGKTVDPAFGKSGYIHIDQQAPKYRLRAYSNFGAYLQTGTTNANTYDVDTAAKAAAGGTLGQTTNNTISLTSPRFLQTYVSRFGGQPVVNFLVTDADGAFDLRLIDLTGTNGSFLGFYRPVAQWGFTNIDYQHMMTPVKLGDISFERTNIPFAPTSIQITGYDQVTIGTTACTIGQYLISSATPQGDAGSAMGVPGYTIRDEQRTPGVEAPRIGGEVFYIQRSMLYTGPVDPNTSAGKILYTNAYWDQTGPTISRPANGAPLVEPTGAVAPL